MGPLNGTGRHILSLRADEWGKLFLPGALYRDLPDHRKDGFHFFRTQPL
jgi:hypothetical protein